MFDGLVYPPACPCACGRRGASPQRGGRLHLCMRAEADGLPADAPGLRLQVFGSAPAAESHFTGVSEGAPRSFLPLNFLLTSQEEGGETAGGAGGAGGALLWSCLWATEVPPALKVQAGGYTFCHAHTCAEGALSRPPLVCFHRHPAS